MLLPLVLSLFTLCAAAWSLVVPPFETPDEPGHARYVSFLMENGRLPRAGVEAPGEAHQPPLYYALAAAAARCAGAERIVVSPERNPRFRWYGGTEESKYLHPAGESPPLSGDARALHWLRLLSVVLGAATVAAIHRMGLAALGDPVQAAVAAALAAFIPQFTFLSASLNNDTLANLLSAGCLACLVMALSSTTAGAGLWLAAGVLAGAGILAKFTGLAMLPCGLIAIFLAGRRRGKSVWRETAAFLSPALLVPLPLLARNLMVMGDPLGAAAQVETLPQLLDRKTLLSPYFVTEFPLVLFRSFWGVFGWMSFLLPWWFYAGCLALTLAAIVGLTRRGTPDPGRDIRLLLAGAIAIQVAQVVVYNITFTQAQGRFLFPVLGPIVLLIVTGLSGLVRPKGDGPPHPLPAPWPALWPWLLVALLACANLCLLRFLVAPAYGTAAGPA